jgi:Sulfotransferase domain
MKPNFLIIGASRSGTTATFHYLRNHPDVYVANGKELHFFDLEWDRGWTWYEAQFDNANGRCAVGEATPSYLYDPVAIDRIGAHLREVRLMAVLRDPIERAYSHYWLNKSRGRESLSFADAIQAEPERLTTDDKRRRLWYSYADQGRYLEQLQRVARLFPRNRMFVSLFDELCADPRAFFVGLTRFLQVDAAIIPDVVGRRVNEFRTYRSLRLRHMSAGLPKRLVDAIAKVNSRVVEYPPIAPRDREVMLERFADANEALGRWLGRDLTAWNGGAECMRTAAR